MAIVRPVVLVPILTIFQMILFIHFSYSDEKNFMFDAAGIIAVFSVALLPNILGRVAHWVK